MRLDLYYKVIYAEGKVSCISNVGGCCIVSKHPALMGCLKYTQCKTNSTITSTRLAIVS